MSVASVHSGWDKDGFKKESSNLSKLLWNPPWTTSALLLSSLGVSRGKVQAWSTFYTLSSFSYFLFFPSSLLIFTPYFWNQDHIFKGFVLLDIKVSLCARTGHNQKRSIHNCNHVWSQAWSWTCNVPHFPHILLHHCLLFQPIHHPSIHLYAPGVLWVTYLQGVIHPKTRHRAQTVFCCCD